MYAQNIDFLDFRHGWFMDFPASEIVLIRIGDPCFNFCLPVADRGTDWAGVHTFEFLDVDSAADDFPVTQEQAAELVAIVDKAAADKKHIVVHCYAGIARSGAVVEFAVRHRGFEDVKLTYRHPNSRVLRLMEIEAGVAITTDTSLFARSCDE